MIRARQVPLLREGAAPIRMIVRAVKDGKGAARTLPGLMLNHIGNEPTAEALEKVLRNFSGQSFNRDYLTTFAATFSRDNFQRRMRQEIDATVKEPA